jgi:hypothetical protein
MTDDYKEHVDWALVHGLDPEEFVASRLALVAKREDGAGKSNFAINPVRPPSLAKTAMEYMRKRGWL